MFVLKLYANLQIIVFFITRTFEKETIIGEESGFDNEDYIIPDYIT